MYIFSLQIKMAVSSRKKLTDYIYLLELIKKNCRGKSEEKYKKLISFLDADTLKFLAECIRNILSPQVVKNIPHNKRKTILKKITPHKLVIKKVINKNTSAHHRKKYLQQGGFWFLPLISTVIPLISSLISGQK